ncbi:MAG: cupin domain-containing protein [Undibacterium sp.]
MKKIASMEAEKFQHGETCLMSEYRLEDERIDAAIAKITGRYPDEGWVLNRVSAETAYVLDGSGRLTTEEEETSLERGDVILIEPGEKFYWEGKMSLLISCAPAWKYSQYEHITD